MPILQDYESLKSAWKKKSLTDCDNLLKMLKVGLADLIFVPSETTKCSDQELKLARDILEIGVQWSVEMKDIDSFQRYMAQLKCFYNEKTQLEESPKKWELIGLHLLYLLSTAELADFHMELALIDHKTIEENVYIKHPVKLEQSLIEGRYNKVFTAKDDLPSPLYRLFTDNLLKTTRVQVGSCIESSFESISPAELTKLLRFSSAEATGFANKRKWKLENGRYRFQADSSISVKPTLASLDVAEKTIAYAKQLEMIV